MAKITKKEAEYVHVDGANYKCDECRDFNPIGLCRLFTTGDRVRWFGSCNKWAAGTPSTQNVPQDIIGIKEAGYVENPARVGYSCKRCHEFDRESYTCEKVTEVGGIGDPDPGFISPGACCDEWKFDKVFSIL